MAGKRLLILGGGFAGLDVARAIGTSRAAREYWDPLLIDKENFFQFNPLLPAVAVGSVETRHIVYPLREMARHRHIRFHKNKAIAIDLARREVRLHNNLVAGYDALVIAIGSVTGVEVAAELLDMMRDTLLPKFTRLHRTDLTVTILEGGDRIVP